MDKELYGKIDLEISDRTATYGDIKKTTDRAIEFGIASICIPPSFVRWVKKYVGNRIKVCMYVGLPFGNQTVNTKTIAIREGLRNGADEFEVAINLNELKSGNVEYIFNELKQLKRACRSKLFKCLADTDMMTSAELATFCKFALTAKSDYLSLGCSFFGRVCNIEAVKNLVCKRVKLKAFSTQSDENSIRLLTDKGFERVGVISLPTSGADGGEKPIENTTTDIENKEKNGV